MEVVKLIILLVYLFVALIIILYNWLYLARTVSSPSQTDLDPPQSIEFLVKASMLIAVFTAVLILFFLVIRFY
jgi:hypothetical protein